MEKLVVNLSDIPLTQDQLSLLAKGLNFCPTPSPPNPGDLRTDLDSLHRRLRLHSFFNKDDDDPSPPVINGNFNSTSEFEHPKFKLPSTFNPIGPPNLETFITLNEFDFNNRPIFGHSGYSNLNKGEQIALKQLMNRKDLIFKNADKGRALIVQSREQYLAQGYELLNDKKFYQKLDHNPTMEYMEEINSFLNTMHTNGEISSDVYEFLFNKECRTSILYYLPKIHKRQGNTVPYRPIVSAINSPTMKISAFVDHFLSPCATRVRSYVKDTTHFLTLLDKVGPLPPNSWLVSLDIKGLYTNIDNPQALLAAKEALHLFRPNPRVKPSNDNLVHLMEFVLTKNNFQFNGDNYQQISGVSMGSKMSPNFAINYLGNFEDDYVYMYHTQPLIWVRYIDDIFLIWIGTKFSLDEFILYLNSCRPNLQFTCEASQTQVSFLDTLVKIQDLTIVTDLYCKPTDSHNYLLFDSAHPTKCKQSIPYSQFLRIRRICSQISDYDKHMKEKALHFIRRGYPLDIIEEAALKARRLNRKDLLYPPPKPLSSSRDNLDRTILTTMYHPQHDILRDITSKNWDLLGKSHTTLNLHQRKPLLAYKRPPNLSNLLVRANCQLPKTKVKTDHSTTIKKLATLHSKEGSKQTNILDFFKKSERDTALQSTSLTNLPDNLPRDTSIKKSSSLTTLSNIQQKVCTNTKCQTCPHIITTDKFIGNITRQTHPCKYNICCKSNNLIYMISCKTCQKQYVGQTKNSLAKRFYSHFFNVRHQKKTDAIGLHFSSPDHKGINDISIHVLEFIRLPPHSDRALILRLQLEKNWIHLLRCPAPRGLNIFD